MASKIAAILLRGQRGGMDGIIYEEKGRDIYDLLWYMNKKIIPDLDYLKAKNIDITNLRELFDKLTLKMNKVNDINLKQDLSPLFTNQTFIENWLKNWHTTYLRLFEDYTIRTVLEIYDITISQDFDTGNFSFTFWYSTENKELFKTSFYVSDYWLNSIEGDLPINIDEKIKKIVNSGDGKFRNKQTLQNKLLKYATLFYQKTENYLDKINHTVSGESIDTKIIRMTAENLNQKEQILLNRSALLSCELEDLLK
jgi:hypothetical protein